jgi:hypothetical protein
MHVPIEVYQLLEDRLGREDAQKMIEAIEVGLSRIEARSLEIAAQHKPEIKDELKLLNQNALEFLARSLDC